ALEHGSPDRSAAPRRPSLSPHVFKKLRGVTVTRGGIIARVLSGWTQDQRLIRLAQPCCRLDQCVEHCRQVEGRAADHLEHVGGGSLLLQRLAQLVEQPRVLDGDNGLRSEVGDQLDLFVRKRTDLLSVDGNRADQLVLLEHRRDEKGTGAASIRKLNEGWFTFNIGLLRPDV